MTPAHPGVAPVNADETKLLEREHELGSIRRWLAEAATGHGRVVLLRGGAGLGKSALLARAAGLAETRGMDVMSARGSELEREMPFGVARALLEPRIRRMDESERTCVLAGAAAHSRPLLRLAAGGAASGDPLGVIHGLYWLCANLSDRTPLLLVVDDLHWLDAQSSRWLWYLGRRIGELPVLVLAGARPAEPGGEAIVERIADLTDWAELVLEPLGPSAVAELVRFHTGRVGEEPFVAACHRATGGNPFFVRELLRVVVSDGLEPVESNARLAPDLGSRGISRWILVRLARLGEQATRLAGAAAVLGGDAALGYAAELAGLDRDRALQAWDALIAGEILQSGQPLEFIHPIARAAIYNEMAVGERSRAHRRAAAILHRDGAGPERVAAQALACEPSSDDELVEWLRAGASSGMRAGAPDAAARYLQRALDEPPKPELRPRVHYALGRALIGLDSVAAAASFDAAARAGGTRSDRLSARRLEAYAHAYAGEMEEAMAAYQDAIELAGDDSEAVQHLAGRRDFYASWWPSDGDRIRRVRELRALAGTLTGRTLGERQVVGAAAVTAIHDGEIPASEALELVNRCNRPGVEWLGREHDVSVGAFAAVTLACEEAAAARLMEQVAIPQCADHGRVLELSYAHAWLAMARFRMGSLLDAEASARTAWEIMTSVGESAAVIYWCAAAVLIEILIARGDVAEAAGAFEKLGRSTRTPPVVVYSWPGVLHGQLLIAQGRAAEGVEVLLREGAWLDEHGFSNPASIPWRARAAPILASLGDRDEAWNVIEPALRKARAFGAPWALGMALRAAGTVRQGDAGAELIREAIAVLERSPCRLELAHARLELGALLRRANNRASAREHLRAALEMAHVCGAVPLRQQAERELAATGARPRRIMLTGLASLTASERQVAELAGAGLSNPEIAQRLFVTRKTVESHLAHVYQKLNIASRRQLPDVLNDPTSASAPARGE